MPRSQVANTGIYPFGAKAGTATPVAADEVMRFKARRGAVLQIRVSNNAHDGDSGDLKVVFQVAPSDANGDPDTFVASSVLNNLSLVDGLLAPLAGAVGTGVVKPGTHDDFKVLMRAGDEVSLSGDVYLRVLATGEREGSVEISGDENLEIIDISN